MARVTFKFRKNHYIVTSPHCVFYPRSIKRARHLVELLMADEDGSLVTCKRVVKRRKLNYITARTVFTNNHYCPTNTLKANVKFTEFTISDS